MARMLIVLLWFSATIVRAVRHIQVEEAQSPVDGPLAPSVGYTWKCPDECLGCCQTKAGGWKYSNDHFKCWLKSRTSLLPPGCEEGRIQERSDGPGFKVSCPFGDGMKGERAKERRKLLRKECGKSAQCCCLNSEINANKNDPNNFLECLPSMKGAPAIVSYFSNKVGKRSRYIRQEPQMMSNTGSCVNTSLVPVEYEQWVENKKVLGTHGRCCLKAEEKTTREKGATRSTFVPDQTAGVGRFHMGEGHDRVTRFGPGGTTQHHTTYHFETRIRCVEFEKLWRCKGSDKGLTPSGFLYQRVPDGVCSMEAKGESKYQCTDNRNYCNCGDDACKM